MSPILLLLVRILAQTIVPAGSASADVVTKDDVLAMMARVPACEACPPDRVGYWERKPAAGELAGALGDTVDGTLTGTRRGDAALGSVYAIWEGGNLRCAVGDGGKAWGAYQLQNVPRWIACDPARATTWWYEAAKASTRMCAHLPLPQRLASLASGSCDRGRVQVARRWAVAEAIATSESIGAQE